MQRVRDRLLADGANVAGVLSGTSGDGIDVVIARMGVSPPSTLRAPEVLAFKTLPFPTSLAARVRSVLDGEATGLRACALLSRDLGRAFGQAARRLADERNLELDLIASHGQTVWHHDGVEVSGPATLQLGDGDFVAEAGGAPVVSDFRQRDIAAGGEGAPLSTLADELIFAQLPRPCAILNLGGMANFTLLDEHGSARGFDTGPANSLLDGLARRFLGRAFDQDGAVAASGKVHDTWVSEQCAHPFLLRAAPKSTGRDTFGAAWLDEVIVRARELGVLREDAQPQDLLASAADFVARSALSALEQNSSPVQWLVLCGGGVHNAALVDRLALRSRAPVASSADFGVDPDAREALVFAVLGARFVLGLPSTQPAATQALAGRILGKFSPAVSM
jgi:anhydro-N-acetylmuramic acid kinase